MVGQCTPPARHSGQANKGFRRFATACRVSTRILVLSLPLKGGGRREASGRGHLWAQYLTPTPTLPFSGGEVASIERLYRSYSSKIHVSLVPPPWLELTTSEPSFSATRVRPPGTIRTPSAPDRTNGRKSTWRGETPFSNE